jgi:hypothetical protein
MHNVLGGRGGYRACPPVYQAYIQHVEELMTTVWRAYSWGNSGANIFEAGEEHLIAVLLGARAGCKLTEDRVDRAVQKFLRKVWKARGQSQQSGTRSLDGQMCSGLQGARVVSVEAERPKQGQMLPSCCPKVSPRSPKGSRTRAR